VLPAVTVVIPVVVATVRVLDSVLGPTSTLTVAVPSSCVAVIVAVPAATVVTVATDAFDVLHFAEDVTSFVAPFTVVPDAVRATVCPEAETKDPGEIVIEAIASPEVKKPGHAHSGNKKIVAIDKAVF